MKQRRWERLLLEFEAQEKDRRRWEADIERTKEQSRGVERRQLGRGLPVDNELHQLRGDGRKQDAISKMSRGDVEALHLARPNRRALECIQPAAQSRTAI